MFHVHDGMTDQYGLNRQYLLFGAFFQLHLMPFCTARHPNPLVLSLTSEISADGHKGKPSYTPRTNTRALDRYLLVQYFAVWWRGEGVYRS